MRRQLVLPQRAAMSAPLDRIFANERPHTRSRRGPKGTQGWRRTFEFVASELNSRGGFSDSITTPFCIVAAWNASSATSERIDDAPNASRMNRISCHTSNRGSFRSFGTFRMYRLRKSSESQPVADLAERSRASDRLNSRRHSGKLLKRLHSVDKSLSKPALKSDCLISHMNIEI